MRTDVVVTGGGPAGLILGLLLSRQGVRTTVLEKHADFLRDFRGDTVHPSTLTLLDEVGLIDRIERLPHRKIRSAAISFASDGRTYRFADFGGLRVRHPYIALVPQWDFLDAVAEAAAASPNFTLLRSTEVTDIVRDDHGVVDGVRATGPDGELEVRAGLTVATDGRHSTIRSRLGLRPRSFGAPMDVLWFRLSRRPDDVEGLQGRVGAGRFMISIDRNDYWQCAWVIPKGGYDEVVAAGLERFRADVADLAPALADRVSELRCWADVSMLTVRVDRLPRWYAPGVLLIGDAAHAMSPVGGVGINLAIQDAVAAARILGGTLAAGDPVTTELLARVQRRRWLPTVGTQFVQRAAQRGLLRPVLEGRRAPTPPLLLKVMDRVAVLRRIPARIVGVGLRPEQPPAAAGVDRTGAAC